MPRAVALHSLLVALNFLTFLRPEKLLSPIAFDRRFGQFLLSHFKEGINLNHTIMKFFERSTARMQSNTYKYSRA